MEPTNERDLPLSGMRILVVDDEFLILVSIEDALCDAGAEIVTASTLPDALKCATDEPLSAALLDVRLGRKTTEAVADVLAARSVPFAFYTGQALPEEIRGKHPHAAVLIKPSKQHEFIRAMSQLTLH